MAGTAATTAPPELAEAITHLMRAPIPIPNDNRKSRRMKLRAPVTMLVREGDDIAAVQVQVRDISHGGLGMFRARPMPLDEPFIVALPRDGDTPLHMLCSVVYYEPLGEAMFSVGGRFIRPLSDAEVRSARATLNQAALGMNDPYGQEYPTRAA